MPSVKVLGKRREYTTERLQELRHEADIAGDVDTRDKLAAMIVEQGGAVPTSEIPADETKVGRLERLRQDALDVNDTDTAEKLAEMIAEEVDSPPDGAEESTDEGTDLIISQLGVTREQYQEYLDGKKTLAEIAPQPPTNGGMDVHVPAETSRTVAEPSETVGTMPIALVGDQETTTDCPIERAPLQTPPETPPAAPQSDEERLEGPTTATAVNNTTASVNAAKRIQKEGYVLAEIPARFGGKVDVIDVKRYGKMLTGVQA